MKLDFIKKSKIELLALVLGLVVFGCGDESKSPVSQHQANQKHDQQPSPPPSPRSSISSGLFMISDAEGFHIHNESGEIHHRSWGDVGSDQNSFEIRGSSELFGYKNCKDHKFHVFNKKGEQLKDISTATHKLFRIDGGFLTYEVNTLSQVEVMNSAGRIVFRQNMDELSKGSTWSFNLRDFKISTVIELDGKYVTKNQFYDEEGNQIAHSGSIHFFEKFGIFEFEKVQTSSNEISFVLYLKRGGVDVMTPIPLVVPSSLSTSFSLFAYRLKNEAVDSFTVRNSQGLVVSTFRNATEFKLNRDFILFYDADRRHVIASNGKVILPTQDRDRIWADGEIFYGSFYSYLDPSHVNHTFNAEGFELRNLRIPEEDLHDPVGSSSFFSYFSSETGLRYVLKSDGSIAHQTSDADVEYTLF